jgi:AsmA protein
MKRFIAIVAAIVVLGALLISAPALLISTDAARARIETQLSAWFGAQVRVGAPPRISVLPRLSLGLDDVSLQGRGWSLTDARLTARLDLSALLGGSTRLASLMIENPTVRIAAPSEGRPQTAFAAGRALQRILRHPLTVSNARVFVGDTQKPVLRDMTLRLASSGSGASVRGAFLFDDQRVEATLALANTSVLAGEGTGSVIATLNAPLAALRIEGMAGEGGASRLVGTFTASTSDLRGLLRRIGYELIGDTAFGVTEISGTGSVSLSALELDTARVELDGNAGEGRLALSDGRLRPRLEGTLAFERLDFSPYLEELRVFSRDETPGPDWMRAPMFQLLSGADIDLRLSAASLVAGALETGPSAVSLLLRDGDLSVNLSETQVAGGTGALTVRARPEAENGYAATATLIGKDLALADLSLPEDGPQVEAGRVGGRLDVTARGATLLRLAQGYGGTMTVDAQAVEIGGGDLDAAMGGLLAGDTRGEAGSRSRFDTIAARLQIDAERLQVSQLEVLTLRHRLELTGSIARADAGLAMRGALTQRGPDPAAADASPAKTMPVLVRGTLMVPRLLPDMTGLTGSPTR